MDWKVAALAFGVMFVAELGDKTQLTVFTLAARHERPWPVFAGAAGAMVLVTFLGAFLGAWLSRHVPTKLIEVGAGLLFVGVGLVILWRARI